MIFVLSVVIIALCKRDSLELKLFLLKESVDSIDSSKSINLITKSVEIIKFCRECCLVWLVAHRLSSA